MCWYYPVRGEGGISRKDYPYRVDVFRGQGAFIVGNLTYRPLVPCAVALDDTKLLDTFHKALQISLGQYTSYQTMDEAYWGQEGMTPDGNGFAHGRQSYLFGYVRHWLRGAASNARLLDSTPWSLPTDQWDGLRA